MLMILISFTTAVDLLQSNVAFEWLASSFCIQEIPASTLCPDTLNGFPHSLKQNYRIVK
jgi:hypothetical protein